MAAASVSQRAWIDELRRAGLDLWFGEVLPVEE